MKRLRARDLPRGQIEEIRAFHRANGFNWLATCRAFSVRPSVVESVLRHRYAWERPPRPIERDEEEIARLRALREELRGWLTRELSEEEIANCVQSETYCPTEEASSHFGSILSDCSCA